MKFLFVLSQHKANSRGGAEIQADILATYLSKKGHEVVYACESIKEIKNTNYRIENLLVPKKSYLSFVNIFRLKDIILDLNPDIIYVRCKTPYLGICRLFSKKIIVYNFSANQDYSKRLVPHNLKEGGVYYSSETKIAKWRFHPSTFFEIFNVFLYKFGLRKSSIITQTNIQKQKLLINLNLKSTVIPNCHLPAKNNSPIKTNTICWIGNIKYFKNPIHFVKLARWFKKTNYEFVMAGRAGPRPLQKKLLDEISITPNIKYLGEITFEESNKLLSKSKLFINTSFTEGFPNTFIQAWSHSTPVLSLYFDMDNILKKGNVGMLSGNFTKMVKDLFLLISDNDKLENLSKNSLKFFEQNYLSEDVNAMHLDFLNSLHKDA